MDDDMTLQTQHDPAGMKYFKTTCLTAAFFVLGLCIALLGPALPTLAYNLEIDVESLSFILTARGCGYLFGSLLCAYLFKRMNSYLLLAICLLGTAVGNFFVPFMPHIALLSVVVLITGLSMGTMDTGSNVLCLNIWGSESEPWMQTLHFFFAFGAIFAPIFAKPFIRESDALSNMTDTNGTLDSVTSTGSMEYQGTSFSSLVEAKEIFPQVAWVFVIAALLCTAVAVPFFILPFAKNTKTESCRKDTTKLEGKAYRMKIMALMSFFYLLYVGTEVTFSLFIYSFAINCDRRYSKSTGTMLNSLFWATFAAGRFAAILCSKCTTPKTMLVLDLVGTSISTVVMCFFPYYAESAEWLLWAAVALYGLSMASLFPTGVSWAEHYITVTEKTATVFVAGASLGEMVLPFIMSFLIARNPMNLMYFCVASTGMCILIFLVLVKVTNSRGQRLDLTKDDVILEIDRTVDYGPVSTSDA